MNQRLEIATRILLQIIESQWQFDITAEPWNKIAARNAVELADLLIQEEGAKNEQKH
jgi:hypothetical protein